MTNHSHFTKEQRDVISQLINQGKTFTYIEDAISKNRRSISKFILILLIVIYYYHSDSTLCLTILLNLNCLFILRTVSSSISISIGVGTMTLLHVLGIL